VRSGPGKTAKNKKEKRKKKYSGQQQKEIDCDEPHPAPNEKTQPIQWTERPTGALVAVNSLWPLKRALKVGQPQKVSKHVQQVAKYGLKFCAKKTYDESKHLSPLPAPQILPLSLNRDLKV
jgi:hypothetical protein